MYVLLAVAAGAIGLFVMLAAAFTAWTYLHSESSGSTAAERTEAVRRTMLRWTVMDVAAFVLFVIGSVFLLTDALAATRDRSLFPPYHVGYLWCGLFFTLIGALFSLCRLWIVLRLTGVGAPDREKREPDQADQTEQRI